MIFFATFAPFLQPIHIHRIIYILLFRDDIEECADQSLAVFY